MDKSNNYSRRSFLKTSATAAAGIPLAMSASSYANIIGSNSRLNVAIAGLNGRGSALINSSLNTKNVRIRYVCDPDSRAMDKRIADISKKSKQKPKAEKDFRKVLEDKSIDALLIAAPDHWHTPMSLMALKADKHVYVEKPCGHNPYEGELLVEAQKRYGKVVQMGNQQRSAPTSIEAVQMINEGAIGKAYYGKAWYANTRGSIGKGKKTAVPDWLDFDLWQGPAPRVDYQDNLVHYNWHWFWNWGTGEICNNGTHEIDICRWALGVDYPTKVSSNGGRYQFDDDWEFYDTQVTSFEFDGGKTITWEGFSCNGVKDYDRGRGALIRGSEGSILLDRGGYILYDKKGKVVKEAKETGENATTGIVGGGSLTDYHMHNFASGIRDDAKLNSHILEGHKSVLLCHLGNISQHLGRSLKTDPKNGMILGDTQAMKMWSREYAPGWDMVV